MKNRELSERIQVIEIVNTRLQNVEHDMKLQALKVESQCQEIPVQALTMKAETSTEGPTRELLFIPKPTESNILPSK